MSNTDEIRWQQRLENFNKALGQLEAACALEKYSNLELAGLAQMFEFSYELFWKTLKDLLFYEGFDKKSPRAVIRQSYDTEYMSEDETEVALDALGKRNLLSHTYDEKVAREAVELIKKKYAPMLRRVCDRLLEKQGQA